MEKIIYILILFFFSIVRINAQSYDNGVVSSAQSLASQVGIEIMKNGGNAVDAAVGVGFALAVVYPQAGNTGGGGFMLIRFPDGTSTSIDYREKAPGLASKDMYLDLLGNVIEGLSTDGHLSAGVPGSVAGLLYALEKYGTMSRAEVMKYAIDFARNGFAINSRFATNLASFREDFLNYEGSSDVFGKKYSTREYFIQTDLAKTLELIKDKGRDGFYKGETADLIIAEMKRGNGIISYADLVNYSPVERDVLKGTYRGYDIISMAPPSSGGICLIYLLNMLENFDLKNYGWGSTKTIQVMTEAMRRVYADRSEFMGDADFVNVPFDILTSKLYAKRRFKDFDENKAARSEDIKHGDAYYRENTNTTHYSVADKKRMLVSVTTTLNDIFGSRVVVKGAGFLLNNEMDDFVIKSGYPNIFGLVGGDANAIAPGKRMLSSMTPTIVTKDGKPLLVLGSPGGGRIITTVLQTIINVIDFGYTLTEAVDLPRFHHQWLPDEIQVEKNFLTKLTERELREMGYKINPIRDFSSVDAIMFLPDGSMTGHSDRRGYGEAIGF